MRIVLCAGILAGFITAVSAPVAASELKVGDLTIRQPWSRETPKGAQIGGAYLTIDNAGQQPDRLLGGSFEAASSFDLHEMSSDGGIMSMRPVASLAIPARGQLALTPGGKHVMLSGLKHPLGKGEVVAGTLTFERAGTVPVRFRVEAIGARGPTDTD